MTKLTFLGLLVALSSPSAWGLEFRVDQSSVVGRETQANALVEEAQRAIPASIADGFRSPVQIRFRDLDGKGPLTKDFCSQERVAGQIRSEREPFVIEINSAFLSDSFEVDCYEGTTFLIAVGAILHELTHLYDSLGQQRISEQPWFLALTGWEPYPRGRPTLRNKHAPRSANRHEFLSPQETFAVNMEYFLLDSSFRCRRPALYRWYAAQTQYSPYPGQSCPAESRALPLIDAESREVVVDPARVAAIDLLIAGPGKTTMSNFGHAMLRLVICAPERQEVSEKCRADKDSNVVVSPVGFGDGLHTSTGEVLSGRHRSYLVSFPYRDVERTYTREDLRELKGYPLKLDDAGKQRLIDTILESYWTYLGDYKLFSNNCADEIAVLLQASTSRVLNLGSVGLLSPKRLATLLLRESMVTEEERYRVPSAAEKIDQEVRKNIGEGPSAEQLLRWTVRERMAWGKEVLSRNPPNLEAVLRDLLGIERVAYDQNVQKLGEKVSNLWWEREKDHQPIVPRAIQGKAGYGIPLSSEKPDRLDRKALGSDLISLARDSNLPEYSEMNESWAWQIELVRLLPRR